MDPRYVNATAVLPPELVRQISDALQGRSAFMWVPARKNINREDRDRYIVRLREEGYQVAHIAMKLFISERTVQRALKRERARRAPSDRPAQGQRPTHAHVSRQSVTESGGNDATE